MAPAKRNHSPDLSLEKGLPANLEAERFVLGSILAGHEKAHDLIESLAAEDFSIEAHRRIFHAIREIHSRGERPDRLLIVSELTKRGHLEPIGGLTYLVSLDEGLPELANIAGYARVIREKSSLRQQIYTYQAAINRALMDDTAEDIAAGVYQALDGIGSGPQAESQTPEQVIAAYPGGISAFLDPSTRKQGILTGMRKFDEATNGLHGGELTILAARPSVGKTSLALQWAAYAAKKHRKPVAFFSLEMSAGTLLSRMLTSEARVDSHKFRCGFVNSEERRRLQLALANICELPLLFFDTPGIGFPDFARHVRKLMKKDLIFVVIDYLQLMAIERSENRNIGIGKISGGMKALAMELGIPILALSQLSRPDKTAIKSPPILSDLRDSGNLEQDADNVHFIWREEMVKPDRQELDGIAEIRIGKQRNGPIVNCPMRFIKHLTRFENRSDDLLDLPEDDEPPPAPPPPEEEW